MTRNDLAKLIRRIDGRPYPAYKDLRGRYDFGKFTLSIERVQGDPFAAPSRLSITIDHRQSELPATLFSNRPRQIGSENFLAREFSKACDRARAKLGSGKSGLIAIDTPSQEILARTCVQIGPNVTTVNFVAGLPANGRRINGRSAERLLDKQIPAIVEQALLFDNLDTAEIQRFAETNEDASYLRQNLDEDNLVAFVADGAILPRASGVDPKSLPGAVPFQSPTSLRRSFDLPNRGKTTGMGIPKGITLIVGGGYHGKSTLLNAIERGVYNHCPDDGREYVVAQRDAVKVRAEDGRSVVNVNLSPFINNLPGGKDTKRFSTENASGSTSQAASIVEAAETGSKTLLLDEDISATNFLIRDARMQQLIADEKEPITPFVKRVRSLFNNGGISTLLVLGGSSDYFEHADLVIAMDNYLPKDLTAEAKALCEPESTEADQGTSPNLQAGRQSDTTQHFIPIECGRFAETSSISPFKRKRGFDDHRAPRRNIKAVDGPKLLFGMEEIDLSLVSQVVDDSQARAIGAALAYASEHGFFDNLSIVSALKKVATLAETDGLSFLYGYDLAEFRLQELAAALNRLRSLRTRR